MHDGRNAPCATISPAVTPRSTTVIAVAALAIATCALGILVGRWTVEIPTPVPSPDEAPDLAPLIAEIRRSNDAVLQAVEARELTPSDTREAAASSSDVLTRLTSAVEQLNELLKSNDGGLRLGRVPPESWRGAGFPSIEAVLTWMRQTAIDSDPDWRKKIDSELRRAHLGWNRNDLFERYGSPAGMASSEQGVTLIYAGPDESMGVRFLTSEGLIISAGVN